MRTHRSFLVFAVLLISLLLLLTVINFNLPPALAQSDVTVTALQQPTPTPQITDISEVGSTDGILVMGIVIVLIVTLPLIFRKK